MRGLCFFVHFEIAYGAYQNSFWCKCFFEFFVWKPRVELQDKMQAGIIFDNLTFVFVEIFFYRFDNSCPFPSVVESHSVYVFFKKSFAYERCQRVLFKCWDRAGIKGEFFIKKIREFFRQNHIADSNCRGKWFWKCVHVNYFAKNIQTEKRRERFSFETEFAVIIIFYYVIVFAFVCPGEHFIAAICRHTNSCRKMMSGAYMGNLSVCCPEFSDRKALFIHIYGKAFGSVWFVNLFEFFIAWIFNTVSFVISKKFY